MPRAPPWRVPPPRKRAPYFCSSVDKPGWAQLRISVVPWSGRRLLPGSAQRSGSMIRGQKLNTNFFFSNFSGTAGISQQNPGISRQKSFISLVSRDIPNFLAPTPSRGRPLPKPKISGLKSLGLGSFFVPEWLGRGDRPSKPQRERSSGGAGDLHGSASFRPPKPERANPDKVQKPSDIASSRFPNTIFLGNFPVLACQPGLLWWSFLRETGAYRAAVIGLIRQGFASVPWCWKQISLIVIRPVQIRGSWSADRGCDRPDQGRLS